MSKVKCTHCHLEYDESVMIHEDGNLFFCCKGCQGVYHLLKDEGLESFYDKLGNKTITPPITSDNDTAKFDFKSFEENFITTTKEGFKKIDLIIEGIHCAACIWLNEKVLYKNEGIIEVNINFTNHKAKIIWDDKKTKLSHIIDQIRSIGYDAYPYSSAMNDEAAKKSKREYFTRMTVAVFASMNIMMLGIAKYSGFFMGMDKDIKHLVHLAEFILSTPVLFYSGWVFFRGAYYGLKNRIINMDFLVSAGATLTYIYSLNVLFTRVGESYFDSVSMIITFVLIGKYLEVIGKKKAIDTLDAIKSTLPIQATIITDNIKKTVSLDAVKIGDIVELKTGERAGIDGTVISGEANFDEASITGESMPVIKTKESKIYSGTVNLDGIIRYKATKNYANSTLNSIVTMIEDSLMHKPPIEKKANKASVFFSFTILGIAVLTFFGWYYFDKELFYLEDSSRFETALIVAISVIVIACPCALALATPMASLVGISWLAKKNILFKEASLLETFAKANTLVLDKTGTITKGKMAVKSSYFLDKNDKDINMLYSLVSSSTHPVSIAIKKYLEKEHKTLEILELQNFKTIQAKGLYATHKESKLVGGNLEILNQFNIQNDINTNSTIFAFAIDSKLTAYFELEDEIKENAKEIIAQIKNLKVGVVMLTGDNENVAASVANAVGIDRFYSNMTPFDKAEYIKSLKDNGKIVVMAGDGVNDAPALSKSNIAITMGAGADISIAVSDVVLLNNSLQALLDSFKISKRTYNFIKQNLAISLIYNTVTIPLAVMGFVIPLAAALSMSLSSLLVVGNSMRIKND